MGFRFQKRIKLFPGVSINLSKSGVSTSLGVRGAHVTLGHDKVRSSVGIPGTGMSYTDIQSSASSPEPTLQQAVAAQSEPGVPIIGPILLIGLAFILLVLFFS